MDVRRNRYEKLTQHIGTVISVAVLLSKGVSNA